MRDERVRRQEVLVPGPAEALAALLGVDLPDPDAGLPLLWHWLYLLDRPATADLGPDGHPLRGVVPAPPGPGRRRMWAGGSIDLRAPLLIGETAARESSIESVRETTGRSGRLTFVRARHRIAQRGRTVVDEIQELAYRDAVDLKTGVLDHDRVLVAPAADEWQLDVTPTLLFRFSALTYNGHRIHYDRDYARLVEGYPDLVTHGPLQALAMAEKARQSGWAPPAGVSFRYRLDAPLFLPQGLVASAHRQAGSVVTSVRDVYGRPTATGELTI